MSNVWEDLHRDYKGKDWLEKPSIFAQEVIKYFPEHGLVLDLGAGQGQDSIFFAENGYEVISSDREISIIEQADNNAKRYFESSKPMRFELVDLNKRIPHVNEYENVVYAHLSLHYFDAVTTKQIFNEIYRILKPGGILAFLVNSTSDPEYGTGEKIEEDVYFVEGKTKRFFTPESAKQYAHQFEPILCDNNGETYKDIDKDVHNLIRFVGRKR